MALIRLVYKSRPTFEIDRSSMAKEIKSILDAARKRNAPVGVTGGLLFTKRHFFQILEGDDVVVDVLYNKIASDPRHGGVEVLAKGPIDERDFDAWSMAHVELDSADFAVLDEALSNAEDLEPETLAELSKLISNAALAKRTVSVKPLFAN